jgi:hypothetical protein
MFKIHPLRCKSLKTEPDFMLFSSRSAAMRLKKQIVRTRFEQFSLAKTKFKHALRFFKASQPDYPGAPCTGRLANRFKKNKKISVTPASFRAPPRHPDEFKTKT